MISYSAFHDELTKIAAKREDDQFVTKEKLKRLLPVILASGLGVGLGTGAGHLVARRLAKAKPILMQSKIKKYVPAAAGIAGGVGGLAHGMWRKNVDKYIREGE